MSAAQLAEIALLALGIAALWLAAIGMLLLPNAMARLHCVAFAGAAGAFCFTPAVLIERVGAPLGLKAILLAILLLLSGAVVVHATGRGLRYRSQFRGEDA